MQRRLNAGVIAALVLLHQGLVHADEGMWTYDSLPPRQPKERHDFTPSGE